MHHVDTIVRASPPFHAAVRRGDAAEALRLGRQIMFACQAQVRDLGERAARQSWAWRVGMRQQPVATHEVAHYLAVSEQVSLTLQGMGLGQLHEDGQCIDPADERHVAGPAVANPTKAAAAEQEELVLAAPTPTRVQELADVAGRLDHISALVMAVAGLVRQADPAVDRLAQSIDAVPGHLDRGNDALLQYYMDRPAGASNVACLAACVRRNAGILLACACLATCLILITTGP
jgi:hypothetical protein